jgi:hypothetical protein
MQQAAAGQGLEKDAANQRLGLIHESCLKNGDLVQFAA